MKTTIQNAAILLFGILLTATACNKENMEDKDWNVLEWTVDGRKHKATCSTGTIISGCDPVDCQYYNDDKYLHIRGTSENGGGVIIHKYRGLKMGTLNILTQGDYFKYGGPVDGDSCTTFISDTSLNYRLFIEELDTIKRIISGSFLFNGIDNCQDTILVKDGYFKLSY